MERDPDGPVTVRASGCFAVPYRIRRRVNLFAGDRVLLLGRVTRDRLAVHPPAAIDTLFTTSFDLLIGWQRSTRPSSTPATTPNWPDTTMPR
ncbi:hypothetical protein [Nocardia sp. alder85J]|uniref:hypothetical protein n=1 Tax=Nocardia sp. alder85J TaxID=2862949 RepID=UPI001CD21F09|nr:hypothetical protein [Nocardia sp. alder85J]MCX4095769.1 hypothetical protein [Nocardia sp. alder85J]